MERDLLQREKNDLIREKEALLAERDRLERGHLEQIGELKRALMEKDEGIADFERRRAREMESLRVEMEDKNNRRLVKTR